MSSYCGLNCVLPSQDVEALSPCMIASRDEASTVGLCAVISALTGLGPQDVLLPWEDTGEGSCLQLGRRLSPGPELLAPLTSRLHFGSSVAPSLCVLL